MTGGAQVVLVLRMVRTGEPLLTVDRTFELLVHM